MIAKIKASEAGIKFCESSNDEIIAFFRYLFALIGLNKKFFPQELEINVLVERAKDTLKNVSLDDLRLSFQFAVDKRTEVDLRLFGDTFSHRLVMEVYDAYKKYKHSMATKLIEKPKICDISEEAKFEIIKKGALRCFQVYSTAGAMADAGNVTYNYLDRMGLIKITKEKKEKILKDAKEYLILKEKNSNASGSVIKAALDKLQNGGNSYIVGEAKRRALKVYFDNLIEMGETLNDNLT